MKNTLKVVLADDEQAATPNTIATDIATAKNFFINYSSFNFYTIVFYSYFQ